MADPPATEGRPHIEVPEYASWIDAIRAEFKMLQPAVNANVVIGALAISTLTLGGNIAYTAVNLDMSGMTGTTNAVSAISGIADFFSSLFGGAPMESSCRRRRLLHTPLPQASCSCSGLSSCFCLG
jgi:hypothetical protein